MWPVIASRSGVELKGFMEIGNLADSHKTESLTKQAVSLICQESAELPKLDKPSQRYRAVRQWG